MVRYIGEPNLHVINYKKPIKEMFCFDESGVYETDDEKLIAWMKKNKPHIRCEEVEEEPVIEEEPVQESVPKSEETVIDKPQESDAELTQLREKAKELGVKRAHLMKKETLLNKIAEIEK